jgi:hypothetical protein
MRRQAAGHPTGEEELLRLRQQPLGFSQQKDIIRPG